MTLWMLRWLPRGRQLPVSTWQARHRVVITLALIQAGLLAVGSALWGPDPAHAIWHGLIVAAPALLAVPETTGRHLRSSLATLSLMAASMMLIYLWRGQTEAHFHFFVMVGVVALYQDWAPFGTALGAVVAHHGILGTLLPHDVFGHHAAYHHPWLWAAIHAGFVLAASMTSLAAWRLNEQVLLRDPLTGLASRTLFNELIAVAARRDQPFGVVYIDLDDFKGVNDTYGHHVGDQVLAAAGARLEQCLRTTDTMARLGGDEFAALVHGSGAQVELVAQQMLSALRQPVTLDGLRLGVGASLGVSVQAPKRGAGDPIGRADAAQRDADTAMYAAKERGKHQVVVHVDGMGESFRRRIDLRQDLRRAVAEEQIEVHYQPIVDLQSGLAVGFEALARWTHPSAGPISPTEFIEWAEGEGIMADLGAQVLDQALETASAVHRSHTGQVWMAVNISPSQLVSDGFVATVVDGLERHGLDSSSLVLEITETTLQREPERADLVLRQLRRRGVQIAIDDFGTGFANLANLANLPADIIKIDRSFVAELGCDHASHTLVAAIIQLGVALGMRVVAEGIETAAQRDALLEMDCHDAQGFLFARPEHRPAFVEPGVHDATASAAALTPAARGLDLEGDLAVPGAG